MALCEIGRSETKKIATTGKDIYRKTDISTIEVMKMSKKQTVLIAGATGNIGGGAALALAKQGAKVVLLGRKIEKLEARANSIRSILSEARIDYQDTDIATLVIDFCDFESIKCAAKEAINKFPQIDCLILSVGHFVQDGPTILPNGHEYMFAGSVIGPFLFTQLMLKKIEQSNGLVLQVIALHCNEIDWNDLESIKNHKPVAAYNRAKMCERVIVGELARRYSEKISAVAFNPSFIIDKSDPELKKRWPKGFFGFIWWVAALIFSKPPSVAGEPIADIILNQNRKSINGALFELNNRKDKADKEMNNELLGERLWNELVRLTEIATQ